MIKSPVFARLGAILVLIGLLIQVLPHQNTSQAVVKRETEQQTVPTRTPTPTITLTPSPTVPSPTPSDTPTPGPTGSVQPSPSPTISTTPSASAAQSLPTTLPRAGGTSGFLVIIGVLLLTTGAVALLLGHKTHRSSA